MLCGDSFREACFLGETGIKDTMDDYEPKSTKYMDSAPGLGAVLRALAAIIKSNHIFEKTE